MAATHSKPASRSITKEDFAAIFRGKVVNCCEITHRNADGCLKSFYDMAKESAIGTALFTAPIYAIQLALHGRNINAQITKQVAWTFCRTAVSGGLLGSACTGSSCLLRNLLGRYTYYTAALAPGTVAGCAVLLDDPSRRGVLLNTVLNLALEYIAIAKRWRLPRLQETSYFMLLSAFLMYQLRTAADRSKLFWFFIPPRRAVQVLGQCCPHTGPCWRDIVKGAAKYSALAVALQIGRIIISMGPSVVKVPGKVKKRLFSKSTVKQALSMGGFVFIYKTVHCLLCRRYGEQRHIFAAIAGLFAGSVYALDPRMEAVSSAAIAVVTLTFRRITGKTFWKNMPVTFPLIALCCGILLHARIMDLENCPSFLVALIDGITNKRSKEIYSNFKKIYDEAVAEGKLNGHPTNEETS